MKVGDLAKIVLPSFAVDGRHRHCDSQLIMDVWYDEKPVLILDESIILHHDGAEQRIVLIQYGVRQTWFPADNLELYEKK